MIGSCNCPITALQINDQSKIRQFMHQTVIVIISAILQLALPSQSGKQLTKTRLSQM